MSKTTLEVLIEARRLIEKPENWTRHEWARKPDGTDCQPTYYAAESFCAHGAIVCAAGGFTASWRKDALNSLRDAVGDHCGFPGGWNDDPKVSHAEVLAAFDKAIEAERTKASP